jgi:hypothetical protein
LDNWGELHRYYVEGFGPEAATIGAPQSETGAHQTGSRAQRVKR